MKIFVIHRFKESGKAKEILKQLSKEHNLKLEPTLLNSTGVEKWKQKAENAIYEAEAVIVFNPESCNESKNSLWEIEKAKEANKEIIEFYIDSENTSAISQLISKYNFKEEFDECFSKNNDDCFQLYEMMVQSSEQLIQRRQKTNAFFITVIGSLLAIAGLLVQSGVLMDETVGILYGLSVVTLLLCKSWSNLIDNYGKLNKAKFDVILRLEKDLGAQIYSAEWVALGKGLRPQKYKSFTATEKNVPLFFGLLIIGLTFSLFIYNYGGK